MKETCKCELRTYMTNRLIKARKESHMSQERFSEILMMDARSYSDLEHGVSFCCTLTFILYLINFCDDVDGMINDMRNIIVRAYDEQVPAS